MGIADEMILAVTNDSGFGDPIAISQIISFLLVALVVFFVFRLIKRLLK